MRKQVTLPFLTSRIKYSLAIAMCLVAIPLMAQHPSVYVNPMIGASTADDATHHGLGKTFPGATTPYGLVQVSPNTITGGDNGSGYSAEHTSIEGFAMTQMSGIGWYGDLGNFLVTPTTGELYTIAGKPDGSVKGYRSHYDKKSESASAGYYSVFLTDHGIKAEMTAAPHTGVLRFTFPAGKESRIQIDLARRVGGTSTRQYVKIVNDHAIQGWMECTPAGGGWGNGDGQADYVVYFYAEFSKSITDFGTWSADIPGDWKRKLEDVTSDRYLNRVQHAEISPGVKEATGKHLGFYTKFPTHAGERVLMKTGISLVSMEGAENNLKTEVPGWDFDAVHQKAIAAWDQALTRVSVKGGTTEQKRTFYTALYHTMIDPRIINDVDGQYPGGDGKAHVAKGFFKRSIFSGWDVFRSQMPLQTIINPALVNDEINSLVTLAIEKKKDYLERWEFLNAYSGCMVGNPAVSVLADAYDKGIRGYSINDAYRLAVGSVEKFGNGEKGFTGGDLSLSCTLEYAYTDWCVGRLAGALGKTADEKKYLQRGEAYKNVFDPEKRWYRPREDNGAWKPWPDSARTREWYGTIESNPYQQGWFVPHDIKGMTEMMGGNMKVIADLEDFFEKTPVSMVWNNYYNHANEPVHHVPFLFNRLGAPWLTQKWTRRICRLAYHDGVEGLIGNEDVGQMSAWFILAAGGIHPVCPGDSRQEITSPLFNEVTFKLDRTYAKGRTFTVKALHNSPTAVYIQSATLNGRPYNKCYIDYKDITAGGKLVLVMGNNPNLNWGLSE